MRLTSIQLPLGCKEIEMEFFPTLVLGWLNGWILLCVWFIVQGLSVAIVQKDVRSRLFEFDRSSWSKGHRVSFALGKLLVVVFLIVAALTPLEFNAMEFFIGAGVYVVGLVGLFSAVHSFGETPLEQPVATGLYKYSRHPQLTMLFIIGIGLGIALQSWILLIIRILAFGLEHAGVIAEEIECLKRFGAPYKEYMERVPRYLLL
jgi:protein-S-isoprenylcysteine O-methyltransferase Ste14